MIAIFPFTFVFHPFDELKGFNDVFHAEKTQRDLDSNSYIRDDVIDYNWLIRINQDRYMTTSENELLVHVNISLDYPSRLKAGLLGINISEVSRNALRVEIDKLENLRQ